MRKELEHALVEQLSSALYYGFKSWNACISFLLLCCEDILICSMG